MGYYVGDRNDAFDFGFWLSSCSGYHPKRRSPWYRLAYLYNFVGTIAVIIVAVQQAVATRNTISDFVQNLESASVFLMVSQLNVQNLITLQIVLLQLLNTNDTSTSLGHILVTSVVLFSEPTNGASTSASTFSYNFKI